VIVSRDLLEAAVALRGASPALWERFLIGMRAYAAAQAAEMVKCEPAMLMRAQGMALAAQEISTLLSGAHEQLEKLKAKAHG